MPTDNQIVLDNGAMIAVPREHYLDLKCQMIYLEGIIEHLRVSDAREALNVIREVVK